MMEGCCEEVMVELLIFCADCLYYLNMLLSILFKISINFGMFHPSQRNSTEIMSKTGKLYMQLMDNSVGGMEALKLLKVGEKLNMQVNHFISTFIFHLYEHLQKALISE